MTKHLTFLDALHFVLGYAFIAVWIGVLFSVIFMVAWYFLKGFTARQWDNEWDKECENPDQCDCEPHGRNLGNRNKD